MSQFRIIWVDDEVDLLKPHILFLEEKGYAMQSCRDGASAVLVVSEAKEQLKPFDVVLLDENMPGLGGLETASQIRVVDPHIPIVMITKNEDEATMEQAIGGQVTDYIIKPVKPTQVLSVLKKITGRISLVKHQTLIDYQKEFRTVFMEMNQANTFGEWVRLYRNIVHWSLRLYDVEADKMLNMLESQRKEANMLFARCVKENYEHWIQNPEDAESPVFSHQAFDRYVLPHLEGGEKTLLLMIDNFRYDQWKTVEPEIKRLFHVESEEIYCSILPTATQFSRNAFFAGMSPLEIRDTYPDKWVYDHEEGGKNQYEEFFLDQLLQRLGKGDIKAKFHKSHSIAKDPKFFSSINELKNYDFVALVYNFIDTLSHSRVGVDVLKELISGDKDYLSITKKWIKDSTFFKFLQEVRDLGFKVILTSDHGTISVKKSVKIFGERDSSSNLRYKYGKRLNCDTKTIYSVRDAEAIKLPVYTQGYSYVFADSDKFFCYPNNYNHFSVLYQDSFQHGGISMEEMMVPVLTLLPKKSIMS